jgi:hypothetical protein
MIMADLLPRSSYRPATGNRVERESAVNIGEESPWDNQWY